MRCMIYHDDEAGVWSLVDRHRKPLRPLMREAVRMYFRLDMAHRVGMSNLFWMSKRRENDNLG